MLCAFAFCGALSAADTIKKALEEAGLDPALSDELAPGKEDTVYRKTPEDGKALRGALFRLLGKKIAKQIDPDKALERMSAFTVRSMNSTEKECAIYLDRKFLEDAGGLLDDFGASADDNYRYVLLHELRHCSADQKWKKGPSLEDETDSDRHATRILHEGGYKNIFNDILLMRSYGTAFKRHSVHDNALYFDALNKGVEPPSFDKMRKAHEEAYPVLRNLFVQDRFRLMGGCEPGIIDSGECKYDPTADIAKLSPLARRRVELFQIARDKRRPR